MLLEARGRRRGFQIDLLPVETIAFQSDLVSVCTFRCPVDHPLFPDSGPISLHTFVFPRTSTVIRHEGRKPFVGGPNVVSFYNRHQVYSRAKVSDEGDHCDWYVVAPDVLLEVIRHFDPGVDDRERPFLFDHGPCDAGSYLAQRRVFLHVSRAARPDALYVEETVLSVLARVVRNAYQVWGAAAAAPTARQRHEELVERAKLLIARRFRDSLSLTEIARTVGSSSFHLCRLFQRHAGMPLHVYQQQLRLRSALEYLAKDRRIDLTDLALDLGYSSHSHFTSVFRRAFGLSPSEFRKESVAPPPRPRARS